MGQKLTLVIDRLHSPIRKLPIEGAHISDAHGSLARLRVCSGAMSKREGVIREYDTLQKRQATERTMGIL